MRMLCLLAVGLALVGAAGAESPVAVTQDDSGKGTVWLQVDLLGIREYSPRKWAAESPAILRMVTVPVDYVAYMVEEHPFQTAGIVFLGLEISSATELTPLGEWFGTRGSDKKSDDVEAETEAVEAAAEEEREQATQQTDTGGDNVSVSLDGVEADNGGQVNIYIYTAAPARSNP